MSAMLTTAVTPGGTPATTAGVTSTATVGGTSAAKVGATGGTTTVSVTVGDLYTVSFFEFLDMLCFKLVINTSFCEVYLKKCLPKNSTKVFIQNIFPLK